MSSVVLNCECCTMHYFGLREDAFGFDDAVGAVLVAFFLHNVALFY